MRFFITTHDAGYPELWEVVRMTDGTFMPISGPYRMVE